MERKSKVKRKSRGERTVREKQIGPHPNCLKFREQKDLSLWVEMRIKLEMTKVISGNNRRESKKECMK